MKLSQAWNSKSIFLALSLHGFLFLGLFQLSFTTEEWNRIKTITKDYSFGPLAKTILHEHGPFGFVTWYYNTHEEARLYYRYAKLTLSGEVDYWTKNEILQIKKKRPWPYRDISIEYQPGALLTLSLPGLFADNFREYRFWLAAWFGFLYLSNLFMGIKLITGGAPTTVQVSRMLWWSLAFLVLLGGIVTSRFDHIVVTCILLSSLAYGHALRNKGNQALFGFALFGFVTSVGVLTKIVPGLILISALLMLLVHHKNTPRWTPAIASVAGFGAGLIFLNAGFYAFFGPGYWQSFIYHMDRGIQLESVYAGVLLLARMAGLATVTPDVSFGSVNVVFSHTNVVKLISPILFFGIVVVLVRRVWHNRLAVVQGEEPGHLACSQIILLTLILLLAFMLTNKVFSPQYMIWIGPLTALLVAIHQNIRKIGRMILIATFMTQGIYPHLYEYLIQFHPALVILLNLRNALLIVILILLIRDLPKLLGKNSLPTRTPF